MIGPVPTLARHPPYDPAGSSVVTSMIILMLAKDRLTPCCRGLVFWSLGRIITSCERQHTDGDRQGKPCHATKRLFHNGSFAGRHLEGVSNENGDASMPGQIPCAANSALRIDLHVAAVEVINGFLTGFRIGQKRITAGAGVDASGIRDRIGIVAPFHRIGFAGRDAN